MREGRKAYNARIVHARCEPSDAGRHQHAIATIVVRGGSGRSRSIDVVPGDRPTPPQYTTSPLDSAAQSYRLPPPAYRVDPGDPAYVAAPVGPRLRWEF